MDERFQGKRLWIGFGALAIIFLCVMLCAFGALAMLMTHSEVPCGNVPYVQPPAGEEGAVPPPTYYGHGPLGKHVGWGPFGILGFGIGLIFKLLFFGLLLLLLLGLVKRLFWGHRYWCPPPTGEEGKGNAGWGPWAWHHHRKHWGPSPWWRPEPEQTGEEDKPGAAEPQYSGPQE